MKVWISLASLVLLSPVSHGLEVCESTYALCTSAVCEPVQEELDKASCFCEVKTGYSVAQNTCQELSETPKGVMLYSRYYPVHSYKICSNAREWAYCLDSPCLINTKDPNKATCLCSLLKNKGDYVQVTDQQTAADCNSGIISSATVDQVNEVTEFLKTEQNLQPFPIRVDNLRH